MEPCIRLIYIGPYQEYELKSDKYDIDFSTGRLSDKGYRFVANTIFPRHAIKKMKSFKVFPTIREALLDACCYDERPYRMNFLNEKFIYFRINDKIYDREHLHELFDLI